jgi:hypothetical protein
MIQPAVRCLLVLLIASTACAQGLDAEGFPVSADADGGSPAPDVAPPDAAAVATRSPVRVADGAAVAIRDASAPPAPSSPPDPTSDTRPPAEDASAPVPDATGTDAAPESSVPPGAPAPALDASTVDAAPASPTCVTTGDPCSTDGDCCDFLARAGFCTDFAGQAMCADSCTADSDCNSGCCATGFAHPVCASAWVCAGRGVGDVCTVDAECTSGLCTGSLSSPGWCTDVCSLPDALCASGAATAAGAPVSCVLNASNVDTCFPGCASDLDCASFAGTTCQSTTDVTGASVSVCSQ